MDEDNDPLVDEEETQEDVEDELPTSVEYPVDTIDADGGVTYVRGPNGKLTPKVD